MRSFCVRVTVTLSGRGLACSPGEVSLYEQFSKHSKIFLGSVGKRIKDAASGQGIYTIFVDEVFKGLPDYGKEAARLKLY